MSVNIHKQKIDGQLNINTTMLQQYNAVFRHYDCCALIFRLDESEQ